MTTTAAGKLAASALLGLSLTAGCAERQQEPQQPVASSPGVGLPPEEPTVAAAPATDTLTGYGATRQAWDANHQAAPGFTEGSAYLPLVNGSQPRYAAVSGAAGERIYSYSLHFAAGTDLEAAKAEVLAEFPPGAVFGVEDADETRCLLVDVRTAEVEAVMEGYRPMVGFFTAPDVSEALDRNRVDYAIFTLAAADETTDLGMC